MIDNKDIYAQIEANANEHLHLMKKRGDELFEIAWSIVDQAGIKEPIAVKISVNDRGEATVLLRIPNYRFAGHGVYSRNDEKGVEVLVLNVEDTRKMYVMGQASPLTPLVFSWDEYSTISDAVEALIKFLTAPGVFIRLES